MDFRAGERPLAAPLALSPATIALLGAMNVAHPLVYRRPVVALLATGDELAPPGAPLRADRIPCSNGAALAALVRQAGGTPHLLPIARDSRESLARSLEKARDADAIVTMGGVSVGTHDLVRATLEDLGMRCAFHGVAMRPGKPLLAGEWAGRLVLGLPGNPVSALVCAIVFVRPVLAKLSRTMAQEAPIFRARLAHATGENGARAHYQRASYAGWSKDGARLVSIPEKQDSAQITSLACADALAISPPHAPAQKAGEGIAIIPLEGFAAPA